MLRQTSLGTLGLWIGGVLTIVGVAAYITDNATLNLAGFFYGIPLLLGGLALKAGELKPIPYTQPTSPEVAALRDRQATVTQNQIRLDVTRYRYGQSAHLDSSLQHLGLRPTEQERPVLQGIWETNVNGDYALLLQFDSPFITLETWQQKREKMEKFFGPDLRVEITQPADQKIELALIATPKTDA
ncbi:hypothetical protein BST81_14445 [Leptolyngbya sp. 'hensonii']|uniref:DUF2854 domain-containing protein n=1 Tax=Leptolyngbya sp. 'hensonii' TaxID=1922337 RepID=UPI00094FADEE|nr:DUF2854 domain-containing protein [Leptolyngbya sp. 'hensonii']OLP17533.1 hypothetical protein BST81_14445 [Leptolyngbya sp. 'hensonii']